MRAATISWIGLLTSIKRGGGSAGASDVDSVKPISRNQDLRVKKYGRLFGRVNEIDSSDLTKPIYLLIFALVSVVEQEQVLNISISFSRIKVSFQFRCLQDLENLFQHIL